MKSLCNSTKFGCALTELEQNLLIVCEFQKTLVSLYVHMGMPGAGLLFRSTKYIHPEMTNTESYR